MLVVFPLSQERMADLATLFDSQKMTGGCWCMWWLIPVKAFHEAGAAGNKAAFQDLAQASEEPMGLLAYKDGKAVGWCAVGPRERYTRAIKTPTYRGADLAEEDVWLAPCFYILPEVRGEGVATALLKAAVELAKQHGASALEGFPYEGDKRRSGGSIQVGVESLFNACGFERLRESSGSRVIMRKEV